MEHSLLMGLEHPYFQDVCTHMHTHKRTCKQTHTRTHTHKM